jgi:hypothetical protein
MKRVLWSVLWSLVGFLVFLLIVFIGLALSPPDSIFYAIFHFLYQNIYLLLMITFLFLLADVFMALPFPASIASPFFSGFGSAGLAYFAISAIIEVDRHLGTGIGGLIASFTTIILLIVFIISFIAGMVEATSVRRRRPVRRRPRRVYPDERDLI